MPSRSVKSTGTSKTVRTVDDVFSQLELDLNADASLNDSRERIRRLTVNNSTLERQSIDELHNPLTIFAPIVTEPSSLIKSMFTNNVVLGGVQATSFFYPLCEFSDAPWDFFCCNNDGQSESFLAQLIQSSGLDLIEQVTADNGNKVAYLRRSMNGSDQPINVRVYASNEHPIQLILSQPVSYQQSYISAVGAVCFWPRLNRKRLCRQFTSNVSKMTFPSGKSKYTINIKKMSNTALKNPSNVPSIYTGADNRIEIVTFNNVCKLDKGLFKKEVEAMTNVVYAVSDKSTKYLGNIAGM